MIIIEDVIIPEEFRGDLYFCCDLTRCKGACCVAGDAGAPLEKEETDALIEYLDFIRPYMQKEAAELITRENLFDFDHEGNMVTALLNDRECIFANFESGVAVCAIEKAYNAKKIPIRKPVSCFLYPIRVSKEGSFRKINYHRWDICIPAVEKGLSKKVKLIDFLRVPLKEKFGRDWYTLLYNALKR